MRLQFQITNYQALLAKYDFNNYAKLAEFLDDLLQDKWQCFQALVEEGHLATKLSLQAAVDATDTLSCSLTTGVIMCWESWLQSSGFPWEVQTTIQDLLFNEDKLFSAKTDESFQPLKDSWMMF